MHRVEHRRAVVVLTTLSTPPTLAELFSGYAFVEAWEAVLPAEALQEMQAGTGLRTASGLPAPQLPQFTSEAWRRHFQLSSSDHQADLARFRAARETWQTLQHIHKRVVHGLMLSDQYDPDDWLKVINIERKMVVAAYETCRLAMFTFSRRIANAQLYLEFLSQIG